MDITEAMEVVLHGGVLGVIKPNMSKFIDCFEITVIDGILYERQVFVDGDHNEFYRSDLTLGEFLLSDFVVSVGS